VSGVVLDASRLYQEGVMGNRDVSTQVAQRWRRMAFCLLLAGSVLGAGAGLRPRAAPSWSPSLVGTAPLTALTVAPGNEMWAYVGDATGRLYRTSDGGRTFHRAAGRLGGAIRVWAVDPSQPLTIYALTSTGLYKSASDGAHYTKIGSGLPPARTVHAIAVITSSVLYAGAATGLLRSDDGGRTFRAQALETPTTPGTAADVWAIGADTRTPARLYVLSAAGINVSNNGGHTWRLDDSTSALVALTVASRAAGGTVYVLTAEGRTLSFRGDGLRDTLTQIEPPPGVSVQAIAAGAHGRLYVGTHGKGVSVSADQGLSWKPVDPPPSTLTITALAGRTGSALLRVDFLD